MHHIKGIIIIIIIIFFFGIAKLSRQVNLIFFRLYFFGEFHITNCLIQKFFLSNFISFHFITYGIIIHSQKPAHTFTLRVCVCVEINQKKFDYVIKFFSFDPGSGRLFIMNETFIHLLFNEIFPYSFFSNSIQKLLLLW